MDRLTTARNLLLAALVFSGLSLSALWLDSAVRPVVWSPGEKNPGFLHGMSGFSLAPSGTPFRNPEARLRSVDLRFCPAFPRTGMDPAGFLLQESPGHRKAEP